MREIKFRVWTQYNIMHYYDWLSILTAELSPDDGLWMQYTGLKDRNGKEIYERDIIYTGLYRRTYLIDFNYSVNHIGEKKLWIECECDAEAIGNMYENPELLKDLK